MKAIVYQNYGTADVLKLQEIDRPVVKDGEVLVKVHATSVTTADWRVRASAFPGVFWLPGRLMMGLFRPKNNVLGGEFAGEVAAVAGGVSQFAVGDRVFGFCLFGGNAEYVVMPESGAIAAMPENLSFEDAAAVPYGALCALVFLRDIAKIQPGQRVLVNGASGGVGVYAIQVARHFGAEVTGVCSTGNLELVASLGAEHVVDYNVEDFAESGQKYDIIFDTVGTSSFAQCKQGLTDTGLFLPLNFALREVFQALWSRIVGGKRVLVSVNGDKKEDLETVLKLLRTGAIRPVIDRLFPLERSADAHRYVEGRHRSGSVVVTVGNGVQTGHIAA